MSRFRFLLTASVYFAAVGFPVGSLRAADLPPAYKASPATPVAYNWTGFYAGVNAGYGWANSSDITTLAGTTTPGSETLKGAIGGAQLGYNWQTGNIVLGLETDIQASGQSASTTTTAGGATFTGTGKIPYFGTVRGRLGYAANNWMPYVTGGWGYGKVTTDLTATGTVVGTGSSSTSRSLWVIGAGVEAALAGNWTWKIEYLYLDFGTITTNVATNVGPLIISSRVKDNVARLGVNYRF